MEGVVLTGASDSDHGADAGVDPRRTPPGAGPGRRSSPSTAPPTQRQLFKQFTPLALSGIFFPLVPPIINAALARSPEPALALAAMGLMRSLSQPLLSPLFGLRQVTTALARDRDMLGRLRTTSVALSCGTSALLLILCLPPVYRLVVQTGMGIPSGVAWAAWPAVLVSAFTPLLGVGRGYFQGVLIHYRRPGPIGTGALGYLLGATMVVWPAVLLTRLPGALLGALGLFWGQAVYVVMVWLPGRRLIRERIPQSSTNVAESQRSVRYILLFFFPLALATMLNAVGEPLIQTAMAHAPDPTDSLAAFPVCFSVLFLAAVPLWNVQQVVIAHVRDHASYVQARRFVWRLGLAWSVALALVGWTPLSPWLFGSVIGVSGRIQALSIQGFRWLALAPLLFAGRTLFYGVLISQDATPHIRTAALVKLAALVLTLATGVWLQRLPGLMVGLLAMLTATAAEVLCLSWYVRGLWRADARA